MRLLLVNSYEFNGAIYKVVDENIFRKMIAQGTDVTKVIKSGTAVDAA